MVFDTGADHDLVPDEYMQEYGASHVMRRLWPANESDLKRNLEQMITWIECEQKTVPNKG